MATLDQLWQSSEESTIDFTKEKTKPKRDAVACAENEIQTPSDFFMKSRPPQTFCVDFVVDFFYFIFVPLKDCLFLLTRLF